MSHTEPRIVPPGEARALVDELALDLTRPGAVYMTDLAHTAAVLGEQRAAVLALHAGSHWCSDANGRAYVDQDHFCPTARVLGVTE
jgi:hypothetical protein